MPDPTLVAQAPATLKRTTLETFDLPAGACEAVIGIAELGPNQSVASHSHAGPEGGYVVAGSGAINAPGRAPIKLSAGQSYQLEAGVAHEVSSGPEGIKLVVTWAKRKGEPLTAG